MSPSSRRRFLGGLAGGAAAMALGAPAAAAQRAQDRGLIGVGARNDTPGRTPNTKFACNVEMWFGALPFVDRIRAAAELGYPAVEFWPWRGKDLDAIAAVCDETGVAVAQFTGWGFTPGLNDPAHHDAFVAEIEAGCETAHRLGCSMMTVVGGNDQPGMTQEEMHAHIVTGLRRAAPVAEREGVMLILEPMNIRVDHKGHCLYGSVDAVEICRAVSSPMVKLNWDLYHMQISEGDLCGRLRDGFDQVGYVQLADHPGRNEPGTGEINYRRVLQELQALGYDGYVGLECRPKEDEFKAAQRILIADMW